MRSCTDCNWKDCEQKLSGRSWGALEITPCYPTPTQSELNCTWRGRNSAKQVISLHIVAFIVCKPLGFDLCKTSPGIRNITDIKKKDILLQVNMFLDVYNVSNLLWLEKKTEGVSTVAQVMWKIEDPCTLWVVREEIPSEIWNHSNLLDQTC